MGYRKISASFNSNVFNKHKKKQRIIVHNEHSLLRLLSNLFPTFHPLFINFLSRYKNFIISQCSSKSMYILPWVRGKKSNWIFLLANVAVKRNDSFIRGPFSFNFFWFHLVSFVVLISLVSKWDQLHSCPALSIPISQRQKGRQLAWHKLVIASKRIFLKPHILGN